MSLDQAWRIADSWAVERSSIAVMHRTAGSVEMTVDTHGDQDFRQRIASLSKPLSAWATLVAVEEGSVSLDDPVGQPGCTLRHLLSHTGGYPFFGDEPVGKPGAKRIYSNTGYDMVAAHVADATGMEFGEYVRQAVFEPLGMASTALQGSCAKDVFSTARDMTAFLREIRRPRLLARDTYVEAVTTVFPGTSGVLPGIGSFDDCAFGLGVEIRAHKSPHWTAPGNSSATFGHFGGIGTFIWYDPVADAGCVMLAEREFDEWGMESWPVFNDAVLRGIA